MLKLLVYHAAKHAPKTLSPAKFTLVWALFVSTANAQIYCPPTQIVPTQPPQDNRVDRVREDLHRTNQEVSHINQEIASIQQRLTRLEQSITNIQNSVEQNTTNIDQSTNQIIQLINEQNTIIQNLAQQPEPEPEPESAETAPEPAPQPITEPEPAPAPEQDQTSNGDTSMVYWVQIPIPLWELFYIFIGVAAVSTLILFWKANGWRKELRQCCDELQSSRRAAAIVPAQGEVEREHRHQEYCNVVSLDPGPNVRVHP